MSETRAITDAEWELQRKTVETLYRNKTLTEVIALMEQDHGFIAKKAQYTRKFKQWGFSKNSTGDIWKFVAQKHEKRKREGKESETCINGKLISKKKVRKEISRYYLPSYCTTDTGLNQEPPSGVEVYTPLPGGECTPQLIEYLHIPWFEFEELVQPYVEYLSRQFYLGLTLQDDCKSTGFLDGCNCNRETHIPEVLPLDQPWSINANGGTSQRGFPIYDFTHSSTQPFDQSTKTTNETQGSLAAHTINEFRSLFAQRLGEPFSSAGEDYASTTVSRLDGYLPEQQPGELMRNVKKMFDLSSLVTASIQLLRYAVFLSSNNLLDDSQMDKLLNWMIKMNQCFLIKRLVRIRTPTLEIFQSQLLLSATRLQEIEMVLFVLAYRVDVNTPALDVPITTALYMATAKQDVRLVRLLLNAGADPNPRISFSQMGSPLQSLVQSNIHYVINYEIVQALLDAGGDANVAPTELLDPNTLLTSAVKIRDAALVQLLLASRAVVNTMTKTSMTALQMAASVNDIGIVETLLDAGADVNAPVGSRYQTARTAAAESGYNKHHLTSAIQFASINSNVELVQILIDFEADVNGYMPTKEDITSEFGDKIINSNDVYWQTPLQIAVTKSNIILVRLLLLSGADANAQQYGDAPLQIAAGKDNIALVRLLLWNGAHVNAAAGKDRGRTALQAAAYIGNSELVGILLHGGADVNAPPAPIHGRSAIQAAAQGGHIDILRTLIHLGADVKAKACHRGGRTCLQAAAEAGNTEIVLLLLKLGAEVNAPAAGEDGRTALQAAAYEHHIPIIDILLKAGADVNAVPSAVKGTSVLYAAIRNGDLVPAQRLLVSVDPNGPTGRHPPIFEAAQRGNFELVQSLIEAGADVNATTTLFTGTQQSVLQKAINCGNIKIVHALLEAKANPNFRITNEILGPLELAVREGSTELVRLLLANGAHANSAPSDKCPSVTALCLALDLPSVPEEIVKDLITSGADVNRGCSEHGLPLCCAIESPFFTKLLLDSGADVNGQWPGGPTALQVVCMGPNIDTIQLLLNAGADINAAASPKWGRTALQAAVEAGEIPIINLLIQNGANCNALAAESDGATALQFAARKGSIYIVLLLLRAGAEINAPSSAAGGRTALEEAAENGRLNVVSFLLKNDPDKDGLDARCQRAAKLAEENDHVFISRILKQYKRNEID